VETVADMVYSQINFFPEDGYLTRDSLILFDISGKKRSWGCDNSNK